MDRLTTLNSASAPLGVEGLSELRPSLGSIPWGRLLPLWRHVVWLVALFVVLAVAVVIRIDVQRLEMDLDRNDRAHRTAQVLNERLTMELDARRRLQAVEGMATSLGALSDVELVDLATVEAP